MAKKKSSTAARRSVARTFIQAARAVSPSEKATFHQITGAGRSHVRREFFGLTPDDEDALVDRLAQQIDQALKEA